MSTYEDHIARQYGDTTECSRCGKQWDTNDPGPPPCISKDDRRRETGKKWIKRIRLGLKDSTRQLITAEAQTDHPLRHSQS